ncbi:hypothetical protein Pla52n_70200 [Stieleria varia]|uniref:DUF6985 domain-containing protein n=2 Tax=Stieleria varia TaxID=2528005 RepID=A0A5C5ZJ62_9BACT|nr:hypothetical protein Pla52n_70200 [Stieleria varia]
METTMASLGQRCRYAFGFRMSTFADSFQQESHGYWRSITERPVLQESRARFDLSVYGCWEEDEEDGESTFELFVQSLGNGAVSMHHEAAWDHLIANRERIEQVLRAELMRHHKLGWSGFQRDRDDDVEGWEDVQDLVDWESESAIDKLYTLTSITLGPEVRDDCAIARFHFHSSWDTEHGLDISLWRSDIAE